MQWPLLLAALALGTAAIPHCAVMCAAPCAALVNGAARSAVGFHAARVVGYIAGGAAAAGTFAAFGDWSLAAPALRPLWTLVHLGFLALGLYWLATGRQLALWRRDAAPLQVVIVHRARPLRATVAGLGWVAWPCATLQGALMLAALANDALGGALVMAAFAVASMPGLLAAPWLWARWRAMRGTTGFAERASALGHRVAGAGLALASGWAVSHGLVERFAAWCAG